jgi:hypothetical protein
MPRDESTLSPAAQRWKKVRDAKAKERKPNKKRLTISPEDLRWRQIELKASSIVNSALADLAERINGEHAAAVASFRTVIDHAIACGRLLIEAKDKVEHGAWIPWLEANCTVTPRLCQYYMRIAREPARPENAKPVSHLTIREAISVTSDRKPKELPSLVEEDPAADAARDFTRVFRNVVHTDHTELKAQRFDRAAAVELLDGVRRAISSWRERHPKATKAWVLEALRIVAAEES